jgi:hypothetical protein
MKRNENDHIACGEFRRSRTNPYDQVHFSKQFGFSSDLLRPSLCNMDYDLLIQCVLQRRSLWDQKDKHYHNRDIKQEVIKNVSI